VAIVAELSDSASSQWHSFKLAKQPGRSVCLLGEKVPSSAMRLRNATCSSRSSALRAREHRGRRRSTAHGVFDEISEPLCVKSPDRRQRRSPRDDSIAALDSQQRCLIVADRRTRTRGIRPRAGRVRRQTRRPGGWPAMARACHRESGGRVCVRRPIVRKRGGRPEPLARGSLIVSFPLGVEALRKPTSPYGWTFRLSPNYLRTFLSPPRLTRRAFYSRGDELLAAGEAGRSAYIVLPT